MARFITGVIASRKGSSTSDHTLHMVLNDASRSCIILLSTCGAFALALVSARLIFATVALALVCGHIDTTLNVRNMSAFKSSGNFLAALDHGEINCFMAFQGLG